MVVNAEIDHRRGARQRPEDPAQQPSPRSKVSRPDRLRADVVSDGRNQQLFYDGKTFTVYQPALGLLWVVHRAAHAGPSWSSVADALRHRPAARRSLRVGDRDQSLAAQSRGAINLGPEHGQRGQSCDHYAFHQADVDWQVWIQQRPQPLPRKLVITSTTEPTQPQHVPCSPGTSPRGSTNHCSRSRRRPNAQRIEFAVAREQAGLPRRGRAGSRGQNPNR